MFKTFNLSIITVNLNNKLGLGNTINSIQSQSYKKIEHIIIDGGSKDGSLEFIERYDYSIDKWISEPDSGIYEAMNKGIKMASGKYLLFLNSGDILINDTIIEKVLALIGDKDIYYGDKINLDQRGSEHLVNFPDELTFMYFFEGGYLPHCSAFIKRDLFDRVFYYNENFRIVADWEFFVCAICKYNASYEHWPFPIAIFEYGGLSQDPVMRAMKNKEGENILSDHFPLFVKDYKIILEYSSLFHLNRFKNLKILERNRTARKLNSIFLKVLVKIFK